MYRVLLIDDERLVLASLRRRIDWEACGFSVCGEAFNGKDGLSKIEELHPDLVFTDIRMPGISGLDLIGQAQKAGTPIISSMGAANKLDPTAFRVADISKTKVSPLAKVIRLECRRRKIRKLKVVYSTEQPIKPLPPQEGEENSPASAAFVPGAAGLAVAGEVVLDLLEKGGALRSRPVAGCCRRPCAPKPQKQKIQKKYTKAYTVLSARSVRFYFYLISLIFKTTALHTIS